MTEPTTAIQKAEQKTITQIITSPEFLAQLRMALPRTGVTAERLARVAVTTLRMNRDLMQCEPMSVLASIMQSAQLGLEPGPQLGLAYIIPYKDNRSGITNATFQIGYKGIVQLLWRSDQIASIAADVVCENDEFEYTLGINPILRHRPASRERGQATHVYAVIGTQSGGWLSKVWTVEQVNDHRQRYSKSRRDSPWDSAWDAMACKTLVKQVAKLAPISTEAQAAIVADDLGEMGRAPAIDVSDFTVVKDDEPSRSQGVKDAAAKAAQGAKKKGEDPEQGELG